MDTESETYLSGLRPLHCELNLLTRSDGSAILTQGETTVMASINGPLEVRHHNMDIDKANVVVQYSTKAGHTSIKDRFIESVIKKSFAVVLITSLHPRSNINIQLQEMEDNGGLLACCLNASCLAAMNSGMEMNFLIAAVHCIITEDDNIVIDPSTKEMMGMKASLTFGFDSIKKDLITVYSKGEFTPEQFEEAITLCASASDHIFKFYKDTIKNFSTAL